MEDWHPLGIFNDRTSIDRTMFSVFTFIGVLNFTKKTSKEPRPQGGALKPNSKPKTEIPKS